MSCILKYCFVNDELCLEMNKEFMKRVDLLQTIFKKIYNSDATDYEKIAMLNYDYLKSKFNVDKSFINWWEYIVKHEYYNVINKLNGNLLPGFWLEDCKVRSEYGYESNFWENFLLFNGVCRSCLLACNYSCCHHHCDNYGHYVHMLSMMHEMKKQLKNFIDLQEEPKLIEKPYCSSFPRCRLEVPEPRL